MCFAVMEHKRTYGFRNFINDLHLWLGIGSGIIIFLICLSGSLLAFEKEIRQLFTERVELQNTGGPPLSLSQLETAIERTGRGNLRSIYIPVEADRFYEAKIKSFRGQAGGKNFLLNPYTAELIVPPPSAADNFMSFMLRLHRWLLLDSSVGRPIVGVATIIFLLLSFSGLVLWFPKKWKWICFKPALTIKTNAHWKRINHDLHNTLGFYALPIVLIMALTGLCWSFDSYRQAAGDLLGAPIFDRGRSERPVNIAFSRPVGIQKVYEIAQEEFPQKGEIEIMLPSRGKPVYSIRNFNPSTFAPTMADELLLASSGKIISKKIFSDRPLNVQIATLIKPIHTGHVFGIFSKFLYLLACLVATSLPVTGTLIWLNKLNKNRKRTSQQDKGLEKVN